MYEGYDSKKEESWGAGKGQGQRVMEIQGMEAEEETYGK